MSDGRHPDWNPVEAYMGGGGGGGWFVVVIVATLVAVAFWGCSA